MSIYSRSSIQNINNSGFWIKENKYNINATLNNQLDIDKIYVYAKD